MPNTQKKVLIALRMAGIAGRDKLAGIFRYLSSTPTLSQSPLRPSSEICKSIPNLTHSPSEICKSIPDLTHSPSEICKSIPDPLHSQSEICNLKSEIPIPDWEISLIRTAVEFTPARLRAALAAHYDGFIVSIPDTEKTAALLADSSVPTVVMDLHDPALSARTGNIVFIRNSAEEIGAAAADFLLSTGRCRSYAFVHNPSVLVWSRDRYRAFRATLRDRGLWCHELAEPSELARLPRPIGVLAANDDRGYDILEWCRAHRVRVPEDALVLGINNDTLICENCRPRLSSVQPDFEAEGYLAAEALARMMAARTPHKDTRRETRGKTKRTETARRETQTETTGCATLFVGVKTIARRDSTADISTAGKLVQKAVAFIRAHALEGIAVTDVVRHLGCSRRLADLRFRELQGSSIGESILTLRLEEVRMRLATTTESIAAISHACGYENENYLKNLFKKRFGMTMRDYRARNRVSPGS